MPRRKSSAAANTPSTASKTRKASSHGAEQDAVRTFEFTGDEAFLAAQAAEARTPLKRKKISVVSITKNSPSIFSRVLKGESDRRLRDDLEIAPPVHLESQLPQPTVKRRGRIFGRAVKKSASVPHHSPASHKRPAEKPKPARLVKRRRRSTKGKSPIQTEAEQPGDIDNAASAADDPNVTQTENASFGSQLQRESDLVEPPDPSVRRSSRRRTLTSKAREAGIGTPKRSVIARKPLPKVAKDPETLPSKQGKHPLPSLPSGDNGSRPLETERTDSSAQQHPISASPVGLPSDGSPNKRTCHQAVGPKDPDEGGSPKKRTRQDSNDAKDEVTITPDDVEEKKAGEKEDKETDAIVSKDNRSEGVLNNEKESEDKGATPKVQTADALNEQSDTTPSSTAEQREKATSPETEQEKQSDDIQKETSGVSSSDVQNSSDYTNKNPPASDPKRSSDRGHKGTSQKTPVGTSSAPSQKDKPQTDSSEGEGLFESPAATTKEFSNLIDKRQEACPSGDADDQARLADAERESARANEIQKGAASDHLLQEVLEADSQGSLSELEQSPRDEKKPLVVATATKIGPKRKMEDGDLICRGNRDQETTSNVNDKASVLHNASAEKVSLDGRKASLSPKPSKPSAVKRLSPRIETSGKECNAKTAAQQKEVGKDGSTIAVAKRVRFAEPPPSERLRQRVGFSSIGNLRRQKGRKNRRLNSYLNDVSVMSASVTGPDEEGRQLLLDEVQYLLDGIFKPTNGKGKRLREVENNVISKSLQSLVELFFRKSKAQSTPPEEQEGTHLEEPEEHSGLLILILAGKGDLLQKMVMRLCTVLGKSRGIDALLALIFVIIFRSTPKLLLIGEQELDLLLNAFFRNSAESLKEEEQTITKKKGSTAHHEGAGSGRQRGRLGRRLDELTTSGGTLKKLNELTVQADIVEDEFKGFQAEPEAATFLMGTAIALMLTANEPGRTWMQRHRRLDKVVAVLYLCEQVLTPKKTPNGDSKQICLEGKEASPPWIGIGCAMRILESAAIDTVCRELLTRESRVCAILTDVVQAVTNITDGPFETEWLVSGALRLCINATNRCEQGCRQFVEKGGPQAILNFIVKECGVAGLVKGVQKSTLSNSVECFDIRVLCLAVLASVVGQREDVCEGFRSLQPEGMEERDHGAISVAIEILRNAESELEEAIKNFEAEDTGGFQRKSALRGERDAEQDKKSAFKLERELTVGYACVLLGSLVKENKENRALIESLMPGQSLLGIANVLKEFLKFHVEYGIVSDGINHMYASIIQLLIDPGAKGDSASERGERASDADAEAKEYDASGLTGDSKSVCLSNNPERLRGDIDEEVTEEGSGPGGVQSPAHPKCQ